MKKASDIFTTIYKNNSWLGDESKSGRGSSISQTEALIDELPTILSQLSIGSLLDLPCGDLHWMKNVNIPGVNYIGGDIVADIIENNRLTYGDTKKFMVSNIISDNLPKVDMIFCRDCLVHFNIYNIKQALRNIKKSGCKYLMTTTFTNRETVKEIEMGDWRPLNLQIPPFNLPKPILLLNEKCTEYDGAFDDKCMGVWETSQLPF